MAVFISHGANTLGKGMNPTILPPTMCCPVAGAAEYTDCIFAGGKTPPTNVLYMTLNNLMVRFQ